jgi:S1-C subfamily serine protease
MVKKAGFSVEARFPLSIGLLKLTMALPFVALLAACSGSQSVLEDRVINVESDAIPAAGPPAGNMSGLLKQTSPSYVTITIAEARRKGRPGDGDSGQAVTSGSGFIVDDSGHVLTAGHVAVKKGYSVTARSSDGRLHAGKVIAIRPANDMALISVKGLCGKPVEPAATPCMPRGAQVFSLGKPHAQGDTARFGQVESMSFGRAVSYNGFGYPDAMVLRMNTKKGESGGPVFNGSGQLTGMVVSTLSDGNGRPLNLAHAVPSSHLADFLCSQVQCSARWRALAGQTTQSCRSSSS